MRSGEHPVQAGDVAPAQQIGPQVNRYGFEQLFLHGDQILEG